MMETVVHSEEVNFCQACSIRNRAICADLDNDEIALLNRIGRQRHLKAGESFMWEGDEAIFVANVVSGVLKLSTQTANGREQILGLAYPSDFLGRPFGDTMPYTAEAVSEALVCVFLRSDFERFARDHSRLEHKLLERTLSELDRTRRWMLLLGRMNAEERLASLLLEIASKSKTKTPRTNSGPDRIDLPLSRQQIADLLGLTIETVSRQFTKMRDEGIIALAGRRSVTICKPDILRKLAA
jgi:CRP/FNR family transcriptional regulator